MVPVRKGHQMTTPSITPPVQQFELLPNSALVSLGDAGTIAGRSRASLYRHFKAGELTLIKVGNSTRVRVGELRRLIGAA